MVYAGHTVINEYGKFALHLLPSGIFYKNVVNVLGNGVALDPENLYKEICELKSRGIEINSENLKISDRASILLPWHRDLDELEELARYIQEASLCGLGQTAPNPVLSTMKYFKDEYIEHVSDNKCRAGYCKELCNLEIDLESSIVIL